MRHSITWALLFVLTIAAIAGAQDQPANNQLQPHQPAARDGEYKLVWADEFNTDGPPDPKNWDYERGFVRNEELQLYQPENARCEGGMLIIEARRQRVDNPRYQEGARGWQRSRQFA